SPTQRRPDFSKSGVTQSKPLTQSNQSSTIGFLLKTPTGIVGASLVIIVTIATILAYFLQGQNRDEHSIFHWISVACICGLGAILHIASGRTRRKRMHSKRLVKNPAVAEKLADYLTN